MKQLEFLDCLRSSWRMQLVLKGAADRVCGDFYFEIGEILGDLGIEGWKSDAFILKVCEICEIEF